MIVKIFSVVVSLIGVAFIFISALMLQDMFVRPGVWENLSYITSMHPVWIPIFVSGGGLFLVGYGEFLRRTLANRRR
jgi:hypothetical protein